MRSGAFVSAATKHMQKSHHYPNVSLPTARLINLSQAVQPIQVGLFVNQPFLIADILKQVVDKMPDIDTVTVQHLFVRLVQNKDTIVTHQDPDLRIPSQQVTLPGQRVQKKTGILIQHLQ